MCFESLYERNIVANRAAVEFTWYSVAIDGRPVPDEMQYVADGKYFVNQQGNTVNAHRVSIIS